MWGQWGGKAQNTLRWPCLVSAWLTGAGQGAVEKISARKWWELYCCSLNNLSNMPECSCGSCLLRVKQQPTAPELFIWHLLGCGELTSPLILILTASPAGTAYPLVQLRNRGLVWMNLSQPSLIRLGSPVLTAVPQKCVAIEDGSTSKPSHRAFTYLPWF